jgi:hypothetical protein
VGKPSLQSPLSVNIRESVNERKYGNAMNVETGDCRIQGFIYIRKHKKEV